MDNQFGDRLAWHKSSASSGAGQCVEVAWDERAERVVVRDTKQNGTGPQLEFTVEEWRAYSVGHDKGEFTVEALRDRGGEAHSVQPLRPQLVSMATEGPGA